MPNEINTSFLHKPNQFTDAVGPVFVIIIEMGNKIALRQTEGMIHRKGSSHHPPPFPVIWILPSLRQIHKPYAGIVKLRDYILCPIGAAVSCDDDFEISIVLIQHGRQGTLAEKMRTVIGCYTNADEGFSFAKYALVIRGFSIILELLKQAVRDIHSAFHNIDGIMKLFKSLDRRSDNWYFLENVLDHTCVPASPSGTAYHLNSFLWVQNFSTQ
jgi:hypothetical protein